MANGVATKAANKVTEKEVTIIAAAPTWLFPSPGSQSLEAKN